MTSIALRHRRLKYFAINAAQEAFMVKVGLWLRCEAKPDKVADVEKLIRDGLGVVDAEPDTKVWFGLRVGPSTFGIFDVFPDDQGRQAHLSGRLGSVLMARSAELFTKPPEIVPVDVMVSKLPVVCSPHPPRFEDAVPEAVPQDAVPAV